MRGGANFLFVFESFLSKDNNLVCAMVRAGIQNEYPGCGDVNGE